MSTSLIRLLCTLRREDLTDPADLRLRRWHVPLARVPPRAAAHTPRPHPCPRAHPQTSATQQGRCCDLPPRAAARACDALRAQRPPRRRPVLPVLAPPRSLFLPHPQPQLPSSLIVSPAPSTAVAMPAFADLTLVGDCIACTTLFMAIHLLLTCAITLCLCVVAYTVHFFDLHVS